MEEFELQMAFEQQSIDVFNMQTLMERLTMDNKNLKKHIEALAMENSKLFEQRKKRATSKNVFDRWEFYHENKRNVSNEYGISDWRLVKKKCDELFASDR